MHNLIRGILERDLKTPANPHKPMLNLGLGKNIYLFHKNNSDHIFTGEPSKANGFELPPIINEVMIDTIKEEQSNGYTMSIGTLEARKAIVRK